MNDTVKRVIRTAAQVGTISAVLALLVAFGVPLSEDQQKAILGLGTVVVALLQNAVEDATGTALLK